MKSSTARKIELLKTLISHDGTGREEREAAQRMLSRLEIKGASESSEPRKWAPRWAGAKYDGSYLPTTEIARLIRSDIKMAVKIAKMEAAPGAVAEFSAFAAAPDGLKYGVTTQYFSGGSSISIRVKNVPCDWGYVMEDRYGNGQECEFPSPSLRAVGQELADIMNAYNFDDSDSMVDHFHVRFYGHVTDEHGMSIGH